MAKNAAISSDAGGAHETLSPLLQPLRIRGMAMHNRIAMSPMTRAFCAGHVPGADVVHYYRRRAEGGVGLVVTEAIATDHPAACGDVGEGIDELPILIGQEAVDGWARVVGAVHAAGAKIVPQIWHQGPMRMPNSRPFFDAVAFAPSGRFGDSSKTAEYYRAKAEILDRPLPTPSDGEIVEVIESFERAAVMAVRAGFDGLALHGAHGYLIDSFLWSETNRRQDRWGGNSVQRTSFAVEIVKRCRKVLGPDRPLLFRFSQWKQQDFRAQLAASPQELEAILGPIADAGVDLFDASTRYFNSPAFPDSPLTLAGWAKKVTGKLAGVVGGVGYADGLHTSMQRGGSAAVDNLPLVAQRMAAGEIDMASVGRALLNDADWWRKITAGEPALPFSPESRLRLR